MECMCVTGTAFLKHVSRLGHVHMKHCLPAFLSLWFVQIMHGDASILCTVFHRPCRYRAARSNKLSLCDYTHKPYMKKSCVRIVSHVHARAVKNAQHVMVLAVCCTCTVFELEMLAELLAAFLFL